MVLAAYDQPKHKHVYWQKSCLFFWVKAIIHWACCKRNTTEILNFSDSNLSCTVCTRWKCCAFAENVFLKTDLWKKWILMLSHDELILMFINKKKRKQRFWFPWNSYKKAQQGRFDGLIPELKLYHHRFHISGCQWGSLSSCQHSWDHIWGCRERILESWLTQSKNVSHTDTAIKAEKLSQKIN